MSDVKISREDWYLLAHLLFCDDCEKQRVAFELLQAEYAEKAKRLESKELYKTNYSEYCRVQQMTTAEYMQRLRQRYNHRID